MFILDSDTCIEFMRGNLQPALAILNETNPALVKVSAIAKAELLTGAEKSANPGKNKAILENFLAPFETIPFDDRCAYEYAAIRAELEAKGMKLAANDLMIAATCLAHHATLVTNNIRHFERIDRLELESWSTVAI